MLAPRFLNAVLASEPRSPEPELDSHRRLHLALRVRNGSASAILGLAFLAGGCSHLGPLDPGDSDQVDVGFVDVEPNNTPDEATPLGVASGPDVTVWVGDNEIGGSGNPADYFVFRTSSQPGLFQFDMCYTPPSPP